jgi:hypothetical protein
MDRKNVERDFEWALEKICDADVDCGDVGKTANNARTQKLQGRILDCDRVSHRSDGPVALEAALSFNR